MSETNQPSGSNEPTASTIAAGKKTPEAAAAPPPKPAAPKAPAPAPKAAPTPTPTPAPAKDSFTSFTDQMKATLGYRG